MSLTTTLRTASFDPTITVSIVLALVALIAPSVTALINNRHLEKMKQLELQMGVFKDFNTEISLVYLKYLESLGNFYANKKSSSGHFPEYIAYQRQYLIASFYASNETQMILDKIDKSVQEKNFDSLKSHMETISTTLNKDIETQTRNKLPI